jgi:hypothetical protein
MIDADKSKRVEAIKHLKSNILSVLDAMEIIAKEGFYVASIDNYISLAKGKIKELEEELIDPWSTAKRVTIIYEGSFNSNQRLVAKYIRHLESQLEHIDDTD